MFASRSIASISIAWVLLACGDQTTTPSDAASNDVSATIDGSSWTANQGSPYASFGGGRGSALVVLGKRCVSCASGAVQSADAARADTLELLRLFIKPFTGPGSYILKPDPATTSALIRRSIVVSTKAGELSTSTLFLSVAGGRIEVNVFDPLAARVSGTFQFDLTDSLGVVRRVRHGAFDLRLWDEPPPISLRTTVTSSPGR